MLSIHCRHWKDNSSATFFTRFFSLFLVKDDYLNHWKRKLPPSKCKTEKHVLDHQQHYKHVQLPNGQDSIQISISLLIMDVCSLLDINTKATCKVHIDMCCLKVDGMVLFSIPTTTSDQKHNTIIDGDDVVKTMQNIQHLYCPVTW